MFFVPPEHHRQNQNDKMIRVSPEKPVCLRNSHLILHRNLVEQVFQNDTVVCMTYYPDKNSLMLAPYFNAAFRNIHKIKQYMLKEVGRDEQAVALHGILFDHGLSEENRFLTYEAPQGLHLLHVHL